MSGSSARRRSSMTRVSIRAPGPIAAEPSDREPKSNESRVAPALRRLTQIARGARVRARALRAPEGVFSSPLRFPRARWGPLSLPRAPARSFLPVIAAVIVVAASQCETRQLVPWHLLQRERDRYPPSSLRREEREGWHVPVGFPRLPRRDVAAAAGNSPPGSSEYPTWRPPASTGSPAPIAPPFHGEGSAPGFLSAERARVRDDRDKRASVSRYVRLTGESPTEGRVWETSVALPPSDRGAGRVCLQTCTLSPPPPRFAQQFRAGIAEIVARQKSRAGEIRGGAGEGVARRDIRGSPLAIDSAGVSAGGRGGAGGGG